MDYRKLVENAFKQVDPGFTLDGERQPYTHDYTEAKRGWGHDYVFTPRNGGLEAHMMGWGMGIRGGDYILMTHSGKADTTRYQFVTIEYYSDPKDMWSAEVKFAPRTEAEKSSE